MKEDYQTVLVFDPDTAATHTARRRRRSRRQGRVRTSYTFSERSTEVSQWWDKHDMPTLVLQSAMAWVEHQSELKDEMTGRGSQQYAYAMEGGNADSKLLEAFKETNFRPITLMSIAERLRAERERMQQNIGTIRGGWLARFFDHIIDGVLTEAKPSVDDKTKSLLKARIRGKKFI